jgi:hypothetical protein
VSFALKHVLVKKVGQLFWNMLHPLKHVLIKKVGQLFLEHALAIPAVMMAADPVMRIHEMRSDAAAIMVVAAETHPITAGTRGTWQQHGTRSQHHSSHHHDLSHRITPFWRKRLLV